jgi:cob(I)alamin adenosyltransferase
MKIYTKTGDGGDTGLYGGARRSKDDIRIKAYGSVDELQAHIGVVIAHLDPITFADVQEVLQKVQYQGFVVCAELARTETKPERNDPATTEIDITWLESQIDLFEKDLPPLTAFIVQGGSPVGSFLHVARAVCRRAERCVVALSKKESVSPLSIRYLNRLSDLLFVLARVANHRLGQPEEEWHSK